MFERRAFQAEKAESIGLEAGYVLCDDCFENSSYVAKDNQRSGQLLTFLKKYIYNNEVYHQTN